LCCKFGLRILTLQSKEKLTCLTQNSISNKIINSEQNILIKRLCDFSATPWGAAQIFVIGASRMGNLLKPNWCFSDTPFNFSIAQDQMSLDVDPEKYVVTINFLPTPAFYPFWNGVYHVLCESLN